MISPVGMIAALRGQPVSVVLGHPRLLRGHRICQQLSKLEGCMRRVVSMSAGRVCRARAQANHPLVHLDAFI